MDSLESRIRVIFAELLKSRDVKITEKHFRPDMILLDSGLDSLGFALLVAKLEAELGYDPFVLMDEPFYPRTYQEFLNVYEKFKDHATP